MRRCTLAIASLALGCEAVPPPRGAARVALVPPHVELVPPELAAPSLRDAPPRELVPLGPGALATGIYAIGSAWSGDCEAAAFQPAKVASHLIVTDEPTRAGGRIYVVKSCGDLAHCRAQYRATLEGRGIANPAIRILLGEADEAGRLHGGDFGGRYEGETCLETHRNWGHLEPAARASRRLVIRERKGPGSTDGGECGPNAIPERDGSGPCTLLVADITFREAGPEVACADRFVCRYSGACSAKAGAPGECVAASEVDCHKSMECSNFGFCSLQGDRCEAGSDDDCAASYECHSHGHCHRVVAPDATIPSCGATSIDDCARSEACRVHGHCRPTPNHGCGAS
jgi:hypothetical protein